ncbi:MAG: hypothetical protein CM1200mP3_14210 [Chloroflexota bacterium]|nr:MAG: hypothetical protein CM1200mP3_14210 [Chloroflexota bacterium]
MKGMTPREVYDKFIEEECPMKKEQTVEDVAKAVAFFPSEEQMLKTGKSFNVNGGKPVWIRWTTLIWGSFISSF